MTDGKLQAGKYVGISEDVLTATWHDFSRVVFCFKATCLGLFLAYGVHTIFTMV